MLLRPAGRGPALASSCGKGKALPRSGPLAVTPTVHALSKAAPDEQPHRWNNLSLNVNACKSDPARTASYKWDKLRTMNNSGSPHAC